MEDMHVDKRIIVATCKDCKKTLSVDKEETDRIIGFVIMHRLMHKEKK